MESNSVYFKKISTCQLTAKLDYHRFKFIRALRHAENKESVIAVINDRSVYKVRSPR